MFFCNCTGIYPILAAAWALVCLPLQIVHLILILAENAIDGLMDLVQFIFSSISPAISTLKSAKAATPPPSMWRALWNDLFSKVKTCGGVGCGDYCGISTHRNVVLLVGKWGYLFSVFGFIACIIRKSMLTPLRIYIGRPSSPRISYVLLHPGLSCSQEHFERFGGIFNCL